MADLHDWLEAARPRTLPAAIAPVLVGSGLAFADGAFRFDAFLGAMIGALAIQVAANFANDASDAARGADTPNRIGPQRMVATGIISSRTMWMATLLVVAVATLAGIYLITLAGWVVAAIGVASLAAMLTYVGGPIPYGYRAMGEVAVFVFFGLVATVGTRYVHDRSAPISAWWLALVMGSLAAAILVANNLRDRPTDSEAGKRTIAVALGDKRTRSIYQGLILSASALIVIGALAGITPIGTLLALLAIPIAVRLLGLVRSATSAEAYIPMLGATARLQLVVGVLLTVGAVVGP